jgi:hypothetical protein
MSTGTEIVEDALSRIGAHSVNKRANSESLETGRKTLNSYISQLEDDCISFGAMPLSALGKELSEPQGLTNVIKDNLAILLQPLLKGTQISPELRVNARVGAAYMVRKYQTVTIPNPVVRDTMPLGQGNRYRHGYIFANEDDTLG